MSQLPEHLNHKLNQLKRSGAVPWLMNFIPYLDRIYIKIKAEIIGTAKPREVTYDTNMNTDITGIAPEIVFCTNDSTYYGCTTTGKVAGTAVWAALH